MSSMVNILHQQKLKPFNTFGIEATAEQMIHVGNQEQLRWFRETWPGQPYLLLSGGSNVLLGSGSYEWVLLMRNRGIKLVSETAGEVEVRVEAGENWHDLVTHCLSRNWHGLENLSLIPGNAGTAPIQNIGAYGVEVGEFIREVEFFDMKRGSIDRIDGSECRFGYRDSIFKHELRDGIIITSVTFKLSKQFNPRISYQGLREYLDEAGITVPKAHDLVNAVIAIRRSKLPDPAQTGNAGSFFKNPAIYKEEAEQLSHLYPELPLWPLNDLQVKIPAGWLIDRAGWKGYRRGDAGVHAKQALVLVNHGSATGREIMQLASDIQTDVKAKFGILLEMEVNLVP